MNTLDSAKRAAGCKAVDEIVENKSVVEIGSGATVAYAVQRLAERVTEEKLDVVCITESYTAQQLIIGSNLILGDLATYPKIMKLQ